VDAHALASSALEWLRAQPPWLAAGSIGLVAGLEYVAPPMPGDTVAVVGGVLVARDIVSAPVMLATITLCSVLGALAAYGVGLLAGTRPRFRAFLFRFVDESSFESVAGKYRRWGRLLILGNRFFPGVRTSFLFAAGLFRVPVVDVVFFGAVSALVWNSLLVGAGAWLGANVDDVIDVVEEYSTVGTAVVVVLLAAWLGRVLWKRRRPA
jgi:membrane protein DedA with SNARE-associated domain